MMEPARTAFLRDMKVFTQREIDSRFNVALERYIKTVTLEAETAIEMIRTMAIPAGEMQLTQTAGAVAAAKSVGAAPKSLESRLTEVSTVLGEVVTHAETLQSLLGKADKVHDELKRARLLADEVRPAMDTARAAVDRLEHLSNDGSWSLPKYREMLFPV